MLKRKRIKKDVIRALTRVSDSCYNNNRKGDCDMTKTVLAQQVLGLIKKFEALDHNKDSVEFDFVTGEFFTLFREAKIGCTETFGQLVQSLMDLRFGVQIDDEQYKISCRRDIVNLFRNEVLEVQANDILSVSEIPATLIETDEEDDEDTNLIFNLDVVNQPFANI